SDGTNGEGCTTPGIAVHIGQHHTGERDGLIKVFGNTHRFLTGHGIGYQQDLAWLHAVANVDNLFHHALVDIETTGCIEDNHVTCLLLRIRNRVYADIDGIGSHWLRIDRYVYLLTQCFDLVDSCRTIHICCNHHRAIPLLAQIV